MPSAPALNPAAAASVALLLGAASAWAQLEVPTDIRLDLVQDTGWVSNDTDSELVVISFPVLQESARSLRLYFSQVELAGDPRDGTGSILRITSLRDGAVQVMNAIHVDQWQRSSAYFNGDAVLVQVIARPRTGPNRLVLESVDVGLPWPPPSKTICGNDDRVPSSDPRVARLLPVGCTTWIVQDCARCFLSAGHCVGFINVCEFNVPFSTTNGSWNHPGPEDQYAVDQASIQSNGGGGTGNDYAYFGCFANSNTGLTAYETQGDAFALMVAPAPGQATIRITGHGTDNTPDWTYNQIQQTQAGPLVTHSGSLIQYQTDTTGGSSGSPVIWDEMDVAVGIHTHGGCAVTTGKNSGTSYAHAGLQNVLANPQGVCAAGGVGGAFSNAGGGLAGPFFSVPTLAGCGSLETGASLSLTLSMGFNLDGMTSTLMVGLSRIDAPLQGGILVPSPDFVIPGLTLDNSTPPSATLTIDGTWPGGVPAGTTLWVQHWVTVPYHFGDILAASNGLALTVP